MTVLAPNFCTPRSDMHRCSASTTTPTPFGLEVLSQPVGDLHRQALLDLEVAGEELDDASELRQPEDPLTRQVADVHHSVERQQVVHAQRVERNRSDEDELVVAVVVGKGRRPEGLRREQLGVGGRHPPRRLTQALVA